MILPVNIAVEGPTDEAVARRLLMELDSEAGTVFGGSGKSQLDARIGSWNQAAKRMSWFVLRDLDRDADCAPSLVLRLLPRPALRMCFRVAVRAVEAWLLGDRQRAARWLRVSAELLPRDPEVIDDPKQKLVNLARRSSSSDIRRDMVPREGSVASVGRGYRAQIQRFVQVSWRPAIAARSCPSLARCLAALGRLRESG